jgi:hypothetical protein
MARRSLRYLVQPSRSFVYDDSEVLQEIDIDMLVRHLVVEVGMMTASLVENQSQRRTPHRERELLCRVFTCVVVVIIPESGVV